MSLDRQLDELIDIAQVYQIKVRSKLEEMKEQLNSGLLNVAVIGQMKRGKSTLINAILEKEILPSGAIPVTSIITELEYDVQPQAELVFQNGSKVGVPIDDLAKYVSEIENPGNKKGIRKVSVRYPSKILEKGIRLYDTPGLGSIFRHNSETTIQFLGEIDVVLFVFATDTPLNETEMSLLDEISLHQTNCIFILNKIDMVNQQDLDILMDFSKKIIKRYTKKENILIMPVCAQQALLATEINRQKLWRDSGMEALIEELDAQLVSKKTYVLEESMNRRVKQAAMRMASVLELQKKAILTPLEQLAANTQAFACFVEESDRTLRENEDLFEAEIKHLLGDFDDQARVFYKRTTPIIQQELEESYARSKKNGSKTVKASMEATVSYNFEQTLGLFRKGIEETMKDQFDKSAGRFLSRLENALQTIYDKAADLFGLQWQGSIEVQMLEIQKSIEFIFGSQTKFYETSPSAYAGRLPGFILNPLIFREMHSRIAMDLDKNCGLIRQYYWQQMHNTALQLKYLQRDIVEEARDEIQKQLDDALEKKSRTESAVQKELGLLSEHIDRTYLIIENLSDYKIEHS